MVAPEGECVSDSVMIPSLEGQPCWLLMNEDESQWARGEVMFAWLEAMHGDSDDDADEWRQYPTLLVRETSGGRQWIMQLPDCEIAFCDEQHADWTVVVEE